MATKTIRQNFVNSYGTDLLIAYFDPGASSTGSGRYNFASYSICNDVDWVKAIGALRTAACLFKLPIDASASVDIVLDTADPNFRPAFFVQLHRSSHHLDAACTAPEGSAALSAAAQTAVQELQSSLNKALETFQNEAEALTDAARVPLIPVCSVLESCGGQTTTLCPNPIGTEAACIENPPGTFHVVCVPRNSASPKPTSTQK